jgi:hypothetical protein
LSDANERDRALDDTNAQRKRQVLLDLRHERLADGDHQYAAAFLERIEPVPQRDVSRHEPASGLGRRGQLADRSRLELVALGQHAGQGALAHRGELEQIGREVSAVEHLASQSLLDVPHRGDLVLDDGRAQGRHR